MTAARPGKNLKAELALFKRRRIRDEASHLFFRFGYEGTTIAAIADQLQVTKPFIYSYYKNKGEILYDIAEVGISVSLEALNKSLLSSGSHWDRLKLVVDQVARLIIENQEHIVVYLREEKNLEQGAARRVGGADRWRRRHRVREKRSLFDHRLAELLTNGHAEGEFDVEDPVLTATTIGGMMSWVALWYQPGGSWSEAEIITHVIRSVARLVLPRTMPTTRTAAGKRPATPQ